MSKFTCFFNKLSLGDSFFSNFTSFINLEKEKILNLVNYLIIRRVCYEPKFHKIYQKFIQNFKKNFKDFPDTVLKKSLEVSVLFLKQRICNISTTELKIIKTLGLWIGRITIGLDKPLFIKHISTSNFLLKAYDRGVLSFILPFFNSLMFFMFKSNFFFLYTPWLNDIFSLLFEISRLVFMKAFLQLDLKIFFRRLSCEKNLCFSEIVFFDFEYYNLRYLKKFCWIPELHYSKKKNLHLYKRLFLIDLFKKNMFIKLFPKNAGRISVIKGRFLEICQRKKTNFTGLPVVSFSFRGFYRKSKLLFQKNQSFEMSLEKILKREESFFNTITSYVSKKTLSFYQNQVDLELKSLFDYGRFYLNKKFFFSFSYLKRFPPNYFEKRYLEVYLTVLWKILSTHFSFLGYFTPLSIISNWESRKPEQFMGILILTVETLETVKKVFSKFRI